MTDKALKWIGGLIGGAILVGLIIKSRKGKTDEKTSNFIGSPYGQKIQFTMMNNTKTTQVVTLFNAYVNIPNPSVGITPSITEFNRTLLNEPKKINSIEIRAMNNSAQAQTIITKICKDASGNAEQENYYPMISAYQVNQGMTTVQPQNLILDGVCYLKYAIAPSTTVTMVLDYDLKAREKKSKKKKKKQKN